MVFCLAHTYEYANINVLFIVIWSHFMKFLLKTFLPLVLLFVSPIMAQAEEGVRKLILQVSDNDPSKMNAALNVAANVSRHYSSLGEEVDIKIVAFNAGLHMLRRDTSPVAKRISNFSLSMPNVVFQACGNTISSMKRKSGKDVPVFEFAKVVPAGVVTIMELDAKGYILVRP